MTMYAINVRQALPRRNLYLCWLAALIGVVLSFMLTTTSAQAAPGDFTDYLDAALVGAAESTPNESVATGRAVFAVGESDAISSTVHYRLTVSDIVSVTGAHLHVGAPGVDGPVLVDLLDGAPLAPDSPVSGQFTLTVTDTATFLGGGMYVNVHTDDYPNGEIRGQAELHDLPAARHALLVGESERPDPVETAARGLARFEIDATATLTYAIDVADIENVIGGHIHRGGSEATGPVVYDLSAAGLTPGTTLTGTIPLTSADVVDLLSGEFYVNVHTTQNPDGEIRGQITGVSLFQADLSGAQEVPAVDTPATGRAVLGLDGDGTILAYRIVVNEIGEIDAAHIHQGARGENGPVIQGVFPPGEFSPSQPLGGGATLTVDNVLALLGGEFYLNVHTPEYGDGEIRGQIMPYTPRTYHHALLTGGAEIPPVETDALGLARLRLNRADGMLHYTLFGRDLENVTAAHIHAQTKQANGNVVFDLDGAGFGEDAPLGGGIALSAENMVDLLTGYYYINVHTAANLDGEIRGQIGGPRPFAADLSGANEVPAVLSPASGRAILALSDDALALSYHVDVHNLADISMAHIHRAMAGSNGGVVVDFMPPNGFGPGAPISGTIAITPGLVFDMARAALYVNVHTVEYPGGEVRGQVMPLTPEPRMLALLRGAEEVPPVQDDGAGLARVMVDADLSMLRYDVWVDALDDISMAHIHRGVRGDNGPVIFDLLGAGGMLSTTLPVGGGVELAAGDWVDLLTGRFYVNVHTTEQPGGAVRGQIGHAPLFAAALSGAHEVPSVESIASGYAVMALDPNGRALDYRVMVEDIDDITLAHIHRAPAGTNGGVVVDFMPPSSFGPGAPISGTVNITRALAFDLARSALYVNVHTTANPGGEVRGQIEALHPQTSYMAGLTGSEEVPAVESAGAGLAWMRLDAGSGYFHYGVAVQELTDIAAAHIHRGAQGENGGVAFGLFDPATTDFSPMQPIAGGQMLTPDDLVDLLTGYFYVNVHTDAQPDGEVRGQVGGAALLAATLAGAHEVPPVETDALGRVVAALEADARTFSLRAHVTGLPQVQAAHIHRAPAGQNGGVIFDLLADGGMLNSATPLTYTTQFTLGQALEMVAGNYYVNAHTTAFAGGEVRGQLMRLTPPSHLHAGLIGGEEVPAVTTDAAGIARLRVHPVLGQLAYRIDVTDIDNVEMAHIHRAERGSNGPVFVNFDLQPGELTSAAPVAGVKTLSGADWVDILSGNAYVNVHTQANAGGEIRGQVTTATPFSTTLSGAAEVPPVTTMASGLAVIALRGDTAALDYRVTVATIDGVSAAHIHTGVAGVNGDVVRDLNGATLTPTTPIAGSVDADNSLIFDLLRGRNYVNVHTAENPGGEIRGQLAQAVVPTEYAVALTPGAEIAPASAAQTDPSGEAILALDPVAGVLLYTLRVMNLDEIVAAHIHRGAVTENGPVVYGLYEGETAFDAENPIAGAIQLGSRDLVDLLTEFFYINVHTTSQPSGAIRGQVTLDSQEEMMPNLFVPQLDRGDE